VALFARQSQKLSLEGPELTQILGAIFPEQQNAKARVRESRVQEDAEAAGEDRKKEVGKENASGEERFAGLGNVEFYPALTQLKIRGRRRPGDQNVKAMNLAATNKRKVFLRLSIATGNTWQVAGIVGAYFALWASRSAHSTAIAVTSMLLAWVLLYFSSHAIAHWLVGRLVGIRFLFYTVGGTGNPEGWPWGVRWIFEHLPFFGVQTDKISMQNARPSAKAIMWSAGVTASAIIPTLGALCAWLAGVPWSGWFCVFALGWALGTLASNWTSRAGDYSKARRALEGS
jgi:hypothetical protein